MNTCTQPAPGCTGCPKFDVPHEPCAGAKPKDFGPAVLGDLSAPVLAIGPLGDHLRHLSKSARRKEGLRSMTRANAR